MIELKTNLWDCITDKYTIPVITTNGSLKRNGEAIMGRGVAYEAAYRYPNLPEMLGRKILEAGNKVHMFNLGIGKMIITFPVKYQYFMRADLDLISRSVDELRSLAEIDSTFKFYLPRPGCGNGKRDWINEIKPIVERLPDNVIIVSL